MRSSRAASSVRNNTEYTGEVPIKASPFLLIHLHHNKYRGEDNDQGHSWAT